MVALDCVKITAGFLSDVVMLEILEKIEEDSGASLTKAEKIKVREYLGAVNIALSTIAVEEMNLRNKKIVVSTDEAKINYSDLCDRLYEVEKVFDLRLGCVDFYALPFSLFVPKPNTEYEVCFKYLPKKVETLFEEIEISPLILPEIIARLMASDILLSKNSYDEASVWREEYRKSMASAKVNNKRRILPYRKLV